MIDPTTCIKTDKIVPTLGVASGTGGDGANGTCDHAVVVLFMCLHILTKFHFAVCVEVEFSVQYKF